MADKTVNPSAYDLVLIACGGKKQSQAARAADLYTGPYFRACLAYARTLVSDDRIRILSAKHGLLRLDRWTEPYDTRLPRGQALHDLQDRVIVQAWKAGLLSDDGPRVAVIGGSGYTELARGVFGNAWTTGLLQGRGGIGQQLKWLRAQPQGVRA